MERCIILSAALLLLGCVSEPIAYEDNKRVLITGKVTYQGQVPIANTPVEAFVRTSGPAVQIGQGTIGEDGVLKIITLSPKDDINVHIEVNSKLFEGFKEGITSYEVNGIRLSEQSNTTYVLPDLVMEEVIEAKVEAIRKTNTTDTLTYRAHYRNPDKTIYLDPETGPSQETRALLERRTFGRIVYPQMDIDTKMIPIIPNDTLYLEYSLENNGVTQTGEVAIPFNEKTNSYVFEF